MTNLIVAAFTLCYFAVTLFLCRGMRLSARDICLAGLMSAATLFPDHPAQRQPH